MYVILYEKKMFEVYEIHSIAKGIHGSKNY